jgi:hypothetical protein
MGYPLVATRGPCALKKNHYLGWVDAGIILLHWFATCDAVWLQQEVRVDCKKSHCRVDYKTIHIVPVAKKFD